ncbi:TIGR01440 family protein [Lactobacillus sp. ESL0791]|uniref:TIGR01440 family protein n=1 Tax=Lactobacillus sp. ESL0791 TaxID=2983234 RepID=UPI0023F6F2B8|nr:TIGR01440 family protein [Lactobacillus sp. ESL0791]MDF7639460.1 TIGR01440 family protein [Lactobacillus sp. ESL0791]
MDISTIKDDIIRILDEYFSRVTFPEGGLFVVGCSTSEIIGNWKGSSSNKEVGETVYNTIHDYLAKRNINIAIQGCEHINRALLVERKVAQANHFEIVSVVPALHAGGATQVAGYQAMKDPVEVEHISAFGGIDIGGTEIGMHVKFVQIPVKITDPKIGMANVVCLKSRPKLIGGERAQYHA